MEPRENSNFCLFAANGKQIYIYTYTYVTVSNEKRKTETETILFNSFTVCSSCKRKFVVCPVCLMKKQMEVIRLQTD